MSTDILASKSDILKDSPIDFRERSRIMSAMKNPAAVQAVAGLPQPDVSARLHRQNHSSGNVPSGKVLT